MTLALTGWLAYLESAWPRICILFIVLKIASKPVVLSFLASLTAAAILFAFFHRCDALSFALSLGGPLVLAKPSSRKGLSALRPTNASIVGRPLGQASCNSGVDVLQAGLLVDWMCVALLH